MQEKKNVTISVIGTQKYEGEESQRIELVTDGVMSHSEDGYHISYIESEMTGLDGTLTTFTIQPNRIILTRSGAVSSEMVFEEGKLHESLYDLGFGALLIGVRARKVQSLLDEHGGWFRMEYTIEIEQQSSAISSYEIAVREAGTPVPARLR